MTISIVHSVTNLLERIHAGQKDAVSELFTVLYHELRTLASALMANERIDHSLQATALVHEVYLRVFKDSAHTWSSREHFMLATAQTMRWILVDFSRAKQAQKRGGSRRREELLTDISSNDDKPMLDTLELHEALQALELEDSRKARVVELRYFGHLSLEETAKILNISVASAKRDWVYARAWLFERLN